MSEPCISIIIPNYNHAQYLPRSVGALLKQSVLPSEIIVADDASTDNSLEVLEALAKQSPIVRISRNERNLGVNATMNCALTLARGDYVGFFPADDESRPGLIENVVRMFRQYPNAGLCSGISEWRCTATGLRWYNGGGMPKHHCYLTPADMVKLSRHGRLAINNQNVVFRRSAFVEAGTWLPELRWFTDWFADCVVGFRHGMCHIPEVLANFYLHPNSYYNSTAHAHKERRAVMAKILDHLESKKYADVTPLIRESGFMGHFGLQMVKLVVSKRKYWPFLTPAFIRQAGKRSAEVIGRRYFPDCLTRLCLKIFYGQGRIADQSLQRY